MASSRGYLDFVLEQLSCLEDIRFRAMMGEFIIYYKNTVVGGVYDDRFLIKNTPSARAIVPSAALEIPYESAKAMILPDVDNRTVLEQLIPAVYGDLKSKK